MLETQHSIISTEIVSEDEIDDLFNQLDKLEPPPYLISRILASVLRLPRPLSAPMPVVWNELDGLVVRNDGKKPC